MVTAAIVDAVVEVIVGVEVDQWVEVVVVGAAVDMVAVWVAVPEWVVWEASWQWTGWAHRSWCVVVVVVVVRVHGVAVEWPRWSWWSCCAPSP